MNYYLLDETHTQIVSGPHDLRSTFVKKLTRTGNPDVLANSQLFNFHLVPEIRATINDTLKPGDPVVYYNRVEIPAVSMTTQEIVAARKGGYVVRTQALLDSVAQSRGYDSILSLCSYENDKDKLFAAEGAAGVVWRGSVWRTAYQILDDLESGQRGTVPTFDEYLAELPQMTWPDGMITVVQDGIVTAEEEAQYAGSALFSWIRSIWGA